ncbi:hypothetical protein Agabi119p4_1475 [Agaricus bisporus var. burnettii]|uniref:Uncharacterized protein n=1 Tax=Agaricus bisporus var. burnettii TaxID=192524 RepID=A0A8H7KJ13_AGABI|nr:hypothetical protein AGABI2DRAFT_196036 [Agaricus bisporus var. bisporus H97]EKV41967.1 hypothetical protein AGABI2DRAFT_196036 [Agaricus bisporus var. bisporus H97]KAF7782099.1 hypothetical protein Agabi119p4_1475 [Agaricus bisporus var. burnettii]
MKFFSVALALVVPALASVIPSAEDSLDARAALAVHLTQAQAEARLIPNGITASSSGGCTTQSNPTCTSYSGILDTTVAGVITLKQAAGVSSLVITGGTEVGHASGTFSHANGFKVDVRHSTGLDNYIKGTFTRIANRGDGFPQWEAGSGNIYCDEGNHWDITYFTCGC